MPWTTDADVDRHHKGLSPKKKKVWRQIANQELASHGDEARAIRSANAAVDRIKESMEYSHEQIDTLVQEALRHNFGDSLSAVHEGIQNALTSDHRRNYDDYDYDDYPRLQHVFGDAKAGHAVYKHGDSHFRTKYNKDGDGYALKGSPEKVQVAYVPSDSDSQESLTEAFDVLFSERYISTAARKKIPAEKFAGKGRSFPIENSDDVHAALDSIGRAGSGNYSSDELKSRILSIAKRDNLAIPTSDKKKTSKESDTLAAKVEIEEIMEESLAVQDDGNALIKLISPGRGSMGYYSAECLKRAAANNTFPAGTRMFMDHQTAQERAARPEGDVQKWVGTLTRAAQYQETGPDGEGLYANARVYKDFVPFVKERKADLGVSMRSGVTLTGKIREGVQEVKDLTHGLSVDFVTRAGRGGKVVEMYESFRSSLTGTVQESDTESAMTAEELKQFADMKLRMDRVEERELRADASALASESLIGSGLSPRGQQRVLQFLLGQAIPVIDGKLDRAKFQESAKKAVTDEIAYVQESGGQLGRPFAVVGMGNGLPAHLQESDDTKDNDAALKNAEKMLQESCDGINGVAKKEGTAAA